MNRCIKEGKTRRSEQCCVVTKKEKKKDRRTTNYWNSIETDKYRGYKMPKAPQWTTSSLSKKFKLDRENEKQTIKKIDRTKEIEKRKKLPKKEINISRDRKKPETNAPNERFELITSNNDKLTSEQIFFSVPTRVKHVHICSRWCFVSDQLFVLSTCVK